MLTHKPDHLRTFSYQGLHRYFLTFCTSERNRLFTTSERVDLVRTQIARTCREEQFAVLAYCFMPDHLHLLVTAEAECCDCRRFIKRLKQYSGFHFKQRFHQSLWQRYGFERTLREDEATLCVARYIVENPIRAKLVSSVFDYPYTGSDVYTLREILEAIQMPEWPAKGGR
jgi:putative transposase